MHYSQDTKSSLIADNIYQYQTLDLKYSSPFSSRLTGLDWASARSNELKEWGASVTCICSAALLSSLLTGATCTIVYNQALHSDAPEGSLNRAQTCIETVSKRKQGGKSYLVWVTERIFIHHIPGCENSGCWSQSINTSLKSACGDCKANSIWSKVYNLHKSFLRSHVCNPSGTG